MHVALELGNELKEIAERKLQPSFKTILTTNFKSDSTNEQENELKKAFMGESKALIIQVNEDHRVKSKCKCYSQKRIYKFLS